MFSLLLLVYPTPSQYASLSFALPPLFRNRPASAFRRVTELGANPSLNAPASFPLSKTCRRVLSPTNAYALLTRRNNCAAFGEGLTSGCVVLHCFRNASFISSWDASDATPRTSYGSDRSALLFPSGNARERWVVFREDLTHRTPTRGEHDDISGVEQDDTATQCRSGRGECRGAAKARREHDAHIGATPSDWWLSMTSMRRYFYRAHRNFFCNRHHRNAHPGQDYARGRRGRTHFPRIVTRFPGALGGAEGSVGFGSVDFETLAACSCLFEVGVHDGRCDGNPRKYATEISQK